MLEQSEKENYPAFIKGLATFKYPLSVSAMDTYQFGGKVLLRYIYEAGSTLSSNRASGNRRCKTDVLKLAFILFQH